MSNEIDALVNDRGQVHGPWAKQASITQQFKELAWAQEGYKNLTHSQQSGLEMIFTKIGRILAGDPGHQDHWDDIAGYARLVSREIEGPRLPRT